MRSRATNPLMLPRCAFVINWERHHPTPPPAFDQNTRARMFMPRVRIIEMIYDRQACYIKNSGRSPRENVAKTLFVMECKCIMPAAVFRRLLCHKGGPEQLTARSARALDRPVERSILVVIPAEHASRRPPPFMRHTDAGRKYTAWCSWLSPLRASPLSIAPVRARTASPTCGLQKRRCRLQPLPWRRPLCRRRWRCSAFRQSRPASRMRSWPLARLLRLLPSHNRRQTSLPPPPRARRRRSRWLPRRRRFPCVSQRRRPPHRRW